MYCPICGCFVKDKRHFNELFKENKPKKLCAKCLKKIVINYRLNVIPLANGKRLFSVNIFDNLPSRDFNLFSDIYSKFFVKLWQKSKGQVLLVDYFREEDIPNYLEISELFSSDIFLLSFLLKTL